MSVLATSIAGAASSLGGQGPASAQQAAQSSPAAAANTQALVRGEPAVFVALSVDAEKRVASYGTGRNVDSGGAKKNIDAKKEATSRKETTTTTTRPKLDTSA